MLTDTLWDSKKRIAKKEITYCMLNVEQSQKHERCLTCSQFGVSWNALITDYVENERGSTGVSLKGQEIHAEIIKKGLEGELIGSALVDMYARLGLLADAKMLADA